MLTNTGYLPFSFYYIYVVSAWPIFGIIYSLASNVITKQREGPESDEVQTQLSPEEIIQRAEQQSAQLIANAMLTQTRNKLLASNVGTLGSGLLQAVKSMRDGSGVSVEEVGRKSMLEFDKMQRTQLLQPLLLGPQEQVVVDVVQAEGETEMAEQQQEGRSMKRSGPRKTSLTHARSADDNTLQTGLATTSVAPERERETEQLIATAETRTVAAKAVEPILADMQAQTTDVTAAIWGAVKKLKAPEDVKFSTRRPYFEIQHPSGRVFLFASLGWAYQDPATGGRNTQHPESDLRDERITKASLNWLFQHRKLDPRLFRYVELGKTINRVVVVNIQAREQILTAIETAQANNENITI